MPVSPLSILELIETVAPHDLPRWQDLPTDAVARVSRVRKLLGTQKTPAAIELAELRHRAEEKLEYASQLVMDREAYEQSTSSRVATWRARRLVNAGVNQIADLTCGIGIDACAMASEGIRVDASDILPERVAFARHNAGILVPDGRVPPVFSVRDALQYPEAECYFVDPSRRTDTGGRGKGIGSLTPPYELIQELVAKGKRVVAKLSSAIPDAEIQQMNPAFIEFVSLKGICREAVAWLGEWNFQASKAAVVDAEHEIIQQAGTVSRPASTPLAYIHEPDAAIIRAGVLDEVCIICQCSRIEGCDSPFLTSDTPLQRPLMHSYQIVEHGVYSPRKLKASLTANNAGKIIVKTKGSDFDADVVRRQAGSGGQKPAVIILTKMHGKNHFFVCQQAFD